MAGQSPCSCPPQGERAQWVWAVAGTGEVRAGFGHHLGRSSSLAQHSWECADPRGFEVSGWVTGNADAEESGPAGQDPSSVGEVGKGEDY